MTIPSELDDSPVHVDHPLVHADGVIFGMDEAEYHAALALSSSGIKNLRASTLDFWARSPLCADTADEETEAKIIGHAYHKRIIEGRAAFEELYAPEIDPDERTIEAEPQGGHWIAGLVALVLIAIGTAGLVLIAIRIWRIML